MKKNSLYLIVAFSAIFYSCEKKYVSDEKMNISKATGQVLALAPLRLPTQIPTEQPLIKPL